MSPPEITPSPDSPARRTVISSRITPRGLSRGPNPWTRPMRLPCRKDWTLPADYRAGSCGLTRVPSARKVRLHDPQGLQAEAQALAVLGRGGIEPGELLNALEAVGDRVPVRVDRSRGGVHVAVVDEIGLERRDELALVLVVVARDGRDRV